MIQEELVRHEVGLPLVLVLPLGRRQRQVRALQRPWGAQEVKECFLRCLKLVLFDVKIPQGLVPGDPQGVQVPGQGVAPGQEQGPGRGGEVHRDHEGEAESSGFT